MNWFLKKAKEHYEINELFLFLIFLCPVYLSERYMFLKRHIFITFDAKEIMS